MTAEALSHQQCHFLAVNKLSHILLDPFPQLRFEHSNSVDFSDVIWQTVPLGRPSEAVALLGQCQGGVGEDDPLSPIVPAHYTG